MQRRQTGAGSVQCWRDQVKEFDAGKQTVAPAIPQSSYGVLRNAQGDIRSLNAPRSFLFGAVSLILLFSLFACVGPPDLSRHPARDLYDRGMDYYQRGKYQKAIEYLQTLTFNHPGDNMIDTAQYYLGLAYFSNDDYALAGAEFSRLISNFPASPYAPQAHLMRAVATFESAPRHFGLDQTELREAIQMFEDFLVDFPESEAVADARAYIKKGKERLARKMYTSGIVYMRVRDPRAAKIYFQKVIDEYLDTEYGALATYQLGEAEYIAQNWLEAHERFENFVLVFPEHEQVERAKARSCKSLYQWGRQALKAEDRGAARERFERYLQVCSSDSKYYDKVTRYLEELPEEQTTESVPQATGSQAAGDDS
ncbi:outer membrane protein assembly factor BamD [candidate division GN15 bacterium]|nr:outer membrane protein assembly factor BamD [candidate division GN15 bacterium]